jgi:hypothetical protein
MREAGVLKTIPPGREDHELSSIFGTDFGAYMPKNATKLAMV